VQDVRIMFQGQMIPVTLSAGVTSGPIASDSGPAALLQRADEALYAAKRGGRNRVMVA
jgi:PleD family two-component response regulator